MTKLTFALIVLMSTIGVASAQSTIPGYRLIASNQCNNTISMSYRVKDYTGIWVTRGWFIIQPGQIRTLNMPTTNRIFYYYGKTTAGNSWGGRGQAGANHQWVRRRAFLHSAGYLSGQGARKVWFRKRTINPNTGTYNLRMTCR